MEIHILNGHEHLDDIKMLFTEHLEALGLDMSMAEIIDEFSNLDKKYRKENERLYIAYVNDTPVGCAALRHRIGKKGGLKRLYVRLPYRRKSLGTMLAEKVVEDAKSLGYDELVVTNLYNKSNNYEFYTNLGFKKSAMESVGGEDYPLFLTLPLTER